MTQVTKDLIFQLALNVCWLSMLATLLFKIKPLQDMILCEQRGKKEQAILSVIFAVIICISCFTGIMVGNYNVNTKVIGAVSAGILGGPIVGFCASVLGAIYVYVASPFSEFGLATAYATILFGLLGGGFYPYFQRGKWKYRDLFVLACFAEIVEMLSILRMTKPFEMAVETMAESGVAMLLMNSIGLLIFISSINTMFIRQDAESSLQLRRVSELMQTSFNLLEQGLKPGKPLEELSQNILEETGWLGVMITDKANVLAWEENKKLMQPKKSAREKAGSPNKDIYQREIEYIKQRYHKEEIPEIGKMVLENGEKILDFSVEDSNYTEQIKDIIIMAVPLRVNQETIGSVIVFCKRQWVNRKSEEELLQYLGMMLSVRITMAELKHQEELRSKAEFKALQFQVNPHFLFNALNTISYVCYENPTRARELLVTLADYFRYNLKKNEFMVPLERELIHVKDYLEIEKARFEEKLTIEYDLPEKMDIRIPTLILQPIVENAVKYGIDEMGNRYVKIEVYEEKEKYTVSITDHGKGFAPDVLNQLYHNQMTGDSVGLSNVHKRMKSIYGEDHGIRIQSTENGSSVTLDFYK